MALVVEAPLRLHVGDREEAVVGQLGKGLAPNLQVRGSRRDSSRMQLHDLAAVTQRANELERHPAAGITRQRRGMQAVVQELLHARWIQHRHAVVLEREVLLVRHGGALCLMVLAAQDDDGAMAARSRKVRMLESVARAVQPGSLSVPVAHHAVHFRVRVLVQHLGAAQHRDRELLVLRGLVCDSMRVERSPRLAHGDVDASQGRSRITSDEGFGAQAGCGVGAHLLHHHPDQRVVPVQECDRRVRVEASIQTPVHQFTPPVKCEGFTGASIERSLMSHHLGSAPDQRHRAHVERHFASRWRGE